MPCHRADVAAQQAALLGALHYTFQNTVNFGGAASLDSTLEASVEALLWRAAVASSAVAVGRRRAGRAVQHI